MKTTHIVRWKVTRGADILTDVTYFNFVFTGGYNLFLDYFNGTAPSAIYASLLLIDAGGGAFGIADTASALEASVNLQDYSPPSMYPQRALWEPTLVSWDDGVDEFGFELVGTATFTVGESGGHAAMNRIRSGVFLIADEPNVFVDGAPLFGAVGVETYVADDDPSPGSSTILFPGDVISITYTIRFQLEETEV